jgi:1-phosphatidylinositol phosphodiesterase
MDSSDRVAYIRMARLSKSRCWSSRSVSIVLLLVPRRSCGSFQSGLIALRDGTQKGEVMPTETSNWMSGIADKVALNELVMPGSHDAGMSETHHCNLTSKAATGLVLTQSLSVGGQLAAGSRYFDIRVDYDHRELVTYHRTGQTGCNGQTLKAVFAETVEFLKANKTETAILKISHIREDRGKVPEIKDEIDLFLTGYHDAMYCNDDPHVNLARIALGDLRGKMVLVFDYDDYFAPGEGRFSYRDGISERQCKKFDGTSNCNTTEIEQTCNLTVCDCYADKDDYEKMKKNQLAKWDKCAKLGLGRLFLLSWTLTPSSLTTVEALAEKANGRLPGVLHDQIVTCGWAKPNIVYIDYVNPVTCRSIIQYNP